MGKRKQQSSARKQKHLSRHEREQIEALLKEGHSVRYISERLDRPPSTVSREINRHARTIPAKGCENCQRYATCRKAGLCNAGSDHACHRPCRKCPHAKKRCPDYLPATCQRMADNRSSLCNACPRRNGYGCSFDKRIYTAREAQEAYAGEWSSRRSGFDLTDDQISAISDVVTPLIRKGQSPYHIIQAHGAELGISEATLRRLVGSCELEARNIDLRDCVRRRPRKKRRDNTYKAMQAIKEGHKWEDFQSFIEETGSPYVQMDCVEGSKDSHSVLLTLHFPDVKLQVALLLDKQDSAHIVDALDRIEEALGLALFAECFPVILTDNGREFSDIYRMEHGADGHERTRIFFCEPNRSDEKGACENNHKYIRYVIPKGTSMDGLSQMDVTLMMDHVNSYRRKSLHGRTPYQAAKALLPEDFLILLGIREVGADDVNLTPGLIFPGGRLPRVGASE